MVLLLSTFRRLLLSLPLEAFDTSPIPVSLKPSPVRKCLLGYSKHWGHAMKSPVQALSGSMVYSSTLMVVFTIWNLRFAASSSSDVKFVLPTVLALRNKLDMCLDRKGLFSTTWLETSLDFVKLAYQYPWHYSSRS
jgi:hypothetical protein